MSDQPTETFRPRPGLHKQLLGALVVAVASAFYFGYDLVGEPLFTDESAYIYHSYYYRLAKSGDVHHPDWLHFAAYDSPPVFKYLIGCSLELHGLPVPASVRSAELWYQGGRQAPADPKLLWAARLPMYAGAVLGVAGMFLLAVRFGGLLTGAIAAGLLATSPLYFTHARRAMGDDLTQALIVFGILGTCVALDAVNRGKRVPAGLLSGLAGFPLGLAAATKLNALPLLAVVMASGLLAAVRYGVAQRSTTAGLTVAMIVIVPAATVMAVTFFAVNPFFYAKPDLDVQASAQGIVIGGQPRTVQWLRETQTLAEKNPLERFRFLLDYRLGAMEESKRLFPDDVLPDLASRLQAIAVSGMGRWTAGGSEPVTRRLNLPPEQSIRQAGAVFGLPPTIWWIVPASAAAVGAVFVARQSWHEWKTACAPVSAAPLLWAGCEIAVLLQNLTLDWDRYYLGLVCSVTLLAAIGVSNVATRIGSRILPAGRDVSASKRNASVEA